MLHRFAELRVAALAALIAAAIASPAAQQGAANGEWRAYAGDPGGTKYAPLAQITKDNLGDLRVAWRWPSACAADTARPRPQR